MGRDALSERLVEAEATDYCQAGFERDGESTSRPRLYAWGLGRDEKSVPHRGPLRKASHEAEIWQAIETSRVSDSFGIRSGYPILWYLAREELDKRRRQQRKDSLPLEESPSPSLSTDASDGDDEGEIGRGPLDHLPDIEETVPRASASSPSLLGGEGGAAPALLGGEGGAAPGSVIARLRAEVDTPEARVLGKRAVSPVGSTAAVEQVAVGALQLPPQRTEGVLGSVKDRLASTDTEAVPLPPPPPLQTRVAVPKQLQPRSSRKRPAEVPTLAPLKALKVNPGSTAHWVAEAQAALQRGAASVRADPKEPATEGGAVEVAPTQTGEGVPPPREGEAREPDRAEVPSVAEATEVEVPGVSEAEAMEAGAPRTAEAVATVVGAPATTEATMAKAGAPGTIEAMMAEAGAPGTTETDVIAARLSAQEVEMKAAEASVELETQSLRKLVFLQRERDVWDQLQRQKGLLASANELLAARSMEVEDLCLHCADAKVKAAMAQEQVTPLATRVKELEEELTRVADEQVPG
ncbi:uncharacterized protein [Miscanthus floridulus]|uniref:uncharacterized protein n=1 Tax=Miscanthus floridulus TaxID=154761 RepID=UPI003458BD27